MPSFFIVAIGGAFGAMARYGTSLAVIRLVESRAPLATWTANLAGCLLIGFLAPMADRLPMSEATRLLVFVGFIGSYTTFSTFSLDTLLLWREGQIGLVLLNAVGSVVAGVVMVWVGMIIYESVAG